MTVSSPSLFRRAHRAGLPPLAAAVVLTLVVPAAAGAQTATDPPRVATRLFVGPDGSKQPQDLGINAHMGIRFGGDWSIRLAENAPLLEAGIGVNMSDAAVHVLDQLGGPSRRTQLFLTVGASQHHGGLVWALAYDHLRQAYYDTSHLAQLRGQFGFDLSGGNEAGVFVAKSLRGADARVLDQTVRLDPISSVNGYFRRAWAATGGDTTLWAGVAAGHHNVVWVLPDNSRSENVFVYGADVHLPLDDRFAILGAANFLTPTSTGTVDAYLGVAFYPWKGARTGRMHRPVLTAANNPTFPVNMHR
jgi:hypothetical protein